MVILNSAQHIRAVQVLVNAYAERGLPRSFEACEHELARLMACLNPECDLGSEMQVARGRAVGVREGK